MYLRINGEDKNYNVTISYFKTQHGKNGVRFTGEEIPETNKGFKYYDDQGNVFADLSDYIYLYKPNQYSTEEDTIEYGTGSDAPLPSSMFDSINSRINNVNNRINEITTYTETITAYYGDKYKNFYNVPEGNISIFFTDYNGKYLVERFSDHVRITFIDSEDKVKAIEKETDVTIMVQ